MPRNKVQFQKGMSLSEFLEHYATEAQCEAALFAWRWPQGFVCPECGYEGHCVLGRGLYQCHRCYRQTSVTAGIRQRHFQNRQKSRVDAISVGFTNPCHNPLSVNNFSPGFTTPAYAMALQLELGTAEHVRAERFRTDPALRQPTLSARMRPFRRDGRVVEGARLESVYTVKRIEGSNPSLSAKSE